MPTLSSNTPAIAAHIKKMSSAQEPGTVMADEPACAEPETALSTGSAAIASKAENHTASACWSCAVRLRAAESRQTDRWRYLQSCRSACAQRANWASWLSCVIYLLSPVFRFLRLGLFQQLAQALQFFGVDATVF